MIYLILLAMVGILILILYLKGRGLMQTPDEAELCSYITFRTAELVQRDRNVEDKIAAKLSENMKQMGFTMPLVVRSSNYHGLYKSEKLKFFIMMGVIQENHADWLITIDSGSARDPRPPYDAKPTRDFLNALNQALQQHSSISELKWYKREAYHGAKYDTYYDQPIV